MRNNSRQKEKPEGSFTNNLILNQMSKTIFILSMALLLHGAVLYGNFILKIEEGLMPPRDLPVTLPPGHYLNPLFFYPFFI